MYSGLVLTNRSGNILGAHQKFNRVAHKHLQELHDVLDFPSIKQILHFEGKNGPDGMKLKSPGKDEPHHFYDPFDPGYTDLLKDIESHYSALVEALKEANQERAAFEAAWLAHAITDGLTPVHHYPYEQELEDLRGGVPKEHVTKKKDKFIIKGETPFQTVKKSWNFWGPKGLFSTHMWFEWGVSVIIAPLKLHLARPTGYDLKKLGLIGLEEHFKRVAREVAQLNMYERFHGRGWTPSLAKDVREQLAPAITRTITLAWHSAILDAKGAE